MLEADVPMVLPDDMDLPAVIHDLACQAITVCHSGKEHMQASQMFQQYFTQVKVALKWLSPGFIVLL